MSLYTGWDPPRSGWACAECGFDYDANSPHIVGDLLPVLTSEYNSRLLVDAQPLKAHPDPSTWSALEYACHVRDCLALYDWRIRKVLLEERPQLPPMRRDALVVERAYNEAEPATVAEEMAENGARLATLLSQVGEHDWSRVGIREGEELSVAWMTLNTLHEGQHHLMDFDRVLHGRNKSNASN